MNNKNTIFYFNGEMTKVKILFLFLLIKKKNVLLYRFN